MACYYLFYRQQGQELAQTMSINADTLTDAERHAAGLLAQYIQTDQIDNIGGTFATITAADGTPVSRLVRQGVGYSWIDIERIDRY